MLSAHVASGLRAMVDEGKARTIVAGVVAGEQTAVTHFGPVPDCADVDALRFEIGSITKVFTALAAQRLVEAQHLAWDTAIDATLADVDFAAADVARITPRELATHTSGLPPLPDNMPMSDPLDPYGDYVRRMLVAYLEYFEPDRLEKAYAYSNLGAGLLGELASVAAGQPYDRVLEERVLAPLGMTDTTAGMPPDACMVRGFSDGATMPNWDGFDALAGAGALVSTLADMLTFVRANFGENDDLAAALDAIREPQPNGETALGWHLRDHPDGDPVFWHNGGTGGYASYLAIRPEKQRAVVLLSASTRFDRLTDLGFAEILDAPPPAVVDLSAYPGAYELQEGFVLSVFVEDDALFGQATGQAPFPLTPAADGSFEYVPADIRIKFQLDDGVAASLLLIQAGQRLPAPRRGDAPARGRREVVPIAADELPAFAGRYRLADGVVLTVLARDGQLFAQVTDQPAYPVFPYGPDLFFYRVVDAQLEFERNGDGDVDAVVLHQVIPQRAPRIN